jgi:integrase
MMKNNKLLKIESNSLKRLSKGGYEFFQNSDFWRLDKDTVINLKILKKHLKNSLIDGFLKTLAFYAENLSSSHTETINNRFQHMLIDTGGSEINPDLLINYRSTLTNETEWYLGTIRGFLKKWHELGYEGVSDEVIELLNGWTLKGNIKGDVVKRLDPHKGPLTDIELSAFNEGTIQAFEQGKITVSELAIGLIASNTGRRQIQISHLKIKDIMTGKNLKGEPMYLINVPRAKQRGATFRSEFRQFAVTKELWTILNMQTQSVCKQIESIIGFEIPDIDRLELPLFPNMSKFTHESDADDDKLEPSLFPDNLKIKHKWNLTELKQKLAGDELHILSSDITETVKKIAKVANIYSERTGEAIEISSVRFRYTMGTRAAREGFGIMVIAELLDHSDTQNANVYIENIPEYAERINQKVGHLMTHYAQAFAGVLVNSEKDAERGNDLNSRIGNNGKGVGTCGSHGFCGARVPIPCYTCIHFQAWVYGLHQRVLDELIAERNRITEITGDIAVAAVNDRTIYAVAEVIRLCETRKKVLENG